MEVFLILLLVVIICWLYKGLSSENVIELDEKLFGLLKKYTIVPDEYLRSQKLDIVYTTRIAREKLQA